MGSSRFIRGLTWLVVVAIMLSAASPALAAHRFVTGEGSLPPGVTRQSEQGADQSISSSAHWEQDSRTSVPPAAASQALTAATQPTATLALTTTGVVTPANPLAIGGAPDALSNVTPPVLTVAADPVQVTPGEVITYSVAITNVADTLLQSVALSDTLPAGLVYVAQSAVGFDYSLRDNRLTWAVPQMAPGQALRGGFQARVTGLALGELITNTVSATSTATPVVMASALVEVAPPRQNRVWATPGEGGWLRSEDRRVDLRVPRGAVGVRTELRYGAQAGLPELPPHIFFAFALDAVDEQGQAVHEFAAPLTLSAFFDPRQVPPGDLARLALFYFDEASGEWRVLPSRVDRHWRRVTAQVDHFSLFGLGVEAPQLSLSYGAQLLPAVHGFVTDEWSGNSSVSIPIELPPGPGGLGLRLGLSYSSEVVNGLRAGASTYTDPNPPGGVVNQDQSNTMNFNAQASIVGWGWNLSGLGQITRNLQHDKWYLGYAGGGYELINDGVNGWQTEPQSFLRIEQPDRWLVWAPDGTRYTFGSANWGNGMAYVRNTGTCNQQVREAHLTEVLDTHLNKAVITYDTETKDIRCQNGSAQPYVRAIRPASIEYFPSGQTNATVLVDFAYLSRTDTGVPGQNDEYIESFWSSQRLSSITVKVRSGSSSSAFTTVRSYELEQDYLWKDQASSEGLLRLTGVTQKGKDGGPLPAQTFTYTTINDWLNHTLLQTAVNGQGGKITYNYANYGNISIGGCGGENTSRYRVSEMLVEDGLGTAAHNKIQTIYTHQQPYSWASGYPACNDDFEFGGYGFVRKEVKDGAGTLYQVVDNRYHQCGTASPPVACGSGNDSMDPRKGMLYRSITSSQAGSGELARHRDHLADRQRQGKELGVQGRRDPVPGRQRPEDVLRLSDGVAGQRAIWQRDARR